MDYFRINYIHKKLAEHIRFKIADAKVKYGKRVKEMKKVWGKEYYLRDIKM